MKLNIRDYESITLVMDDIEYYLTKENIGFTLNRIDGETIIVDTSAKKLKLDKVY